MRLCENDDGTGACCELAPGRYSKPFTGTGSYPDPDWAFAASSSSEYSPVLKLHGGLRG